jgi:CheY-specific phosphatase CheX
VTSSPSRADALAAAFIRVAETSFFAFAEPAPPGAAASGDTWYAATVHFSGPFAGWVMLNITPALAHELAASFLGEGEVTEQAVRDLCGEFANQVTGAWLTDLNPGVCFDLAAPAVAPSDRPVGDIAMQVNDQPVLLSLEVAGGSR